MTDQPRDIHGSPLYVGDRVALIVYKDEPYSTDPRGPVARLAVRRIDGMDDKWIYYPEIDGLPGKTRKNTLGSRALRLP